MANRVVEKDVKYGKRFIKAYYILTVKRLPRKLKKKLKKYNPHER